MVRGSSAAPGSRAGRAPPTSRRVPRGRAPSWARRGRGRADGARAPSPRRAAASVRPSRCGRAHRLLAQREQLEELAGAPLHLGPAHPLQASLEDEVLEPVALAVDAGGLRHIADRAPYRDGLAAHVVPCHRGGAAVGRAQGDEDPHGRRFPGSVRPEQAEDLALGEEKVIPARAGRPSRTSSRARRRRSRPSASVAVRRRRSGRRAILRRGYAGSAATSSRW